MAKKISELTSLTTPDAADEIPVVDVSANTTKRTTVTGIHNAMPNGTVIPDRLGTGGVSDHVATSQGTTSTSYTDLTTSGPAVTVTIGANGLALVAWSAIMTNTSGTAATIMSFALSGANTVAAGDDDAFFWRSSVSGQSQSYSGVRLLTGLTAGSTTFTAKYRVTAGTGNFLNRKLSVVPL